MSDRALSPPLSKPVASKDNMALIARLLPLDIAVFLVYLTVGAPLPVIPLFVNDRLGFDPIIVGIVIGAQAAATLLARPLAGGVSDKRGTRAAVMIGALISVLAGVFYFIGTLLESSPVASLVAIIAGRMALGLGDSLFLTGAMAWGVQLGGPKNAGKGLMSVGIALYAAMAIGAPLGIAIFNSGGFAVLALMVAATPLLACVIAQRLPAQPVVPGVRIPLREVFGLIWRPGAGVALSGVGFAVIGDRRPAAAVVCAAAGHRPARRRADRVRLFARLSRDLPRGGASRPAAEPRLGNRRLCRLPRFFAGLGGAGGRPDGRAARLFGDLSDGRGLCRIGRDADDRPADRGDSGLAARSAIAIKRG